MHPEHCFKVNVLQQKTPHQTSMHCACRFVVKKLRYTTRWDITEYPSPKYVTVLYVHLYLGLPYGSNYNAYNRRKQTKAISISNIVFMCRLRR